MGYLNYFIVSISPYNVKNNFTLQRVSISKLIKSLESIQNNYTKYQQIQRITVLNLYNNYTFKINLKCNTVGLFVGLF